MSYEQTLAEEKKVYENCVDVHRLPPIFHYWSNRHLLPKLQSFGFSSPNGMFAQHLEEACRISRNSPRFLSLGAGNCDLEIQLARSLEANGRDFTLDCLDLNPAMLERGRQAAHAAGLSQLNFIAGDLNSFHPAREYDAVIASQSLHHVVNLEGLFDQVKRSLRPRGRFLISDMIGRNGHQRWPEALAIVQEFWRRLPPSYRFNQVIGYYEERFQNWDCSLEGFEGVRSQDILPLLIERFHFHLFVPYGNLIDPFIDRAFGHHFDPQAEWDRAFIDEVQQRDDDELASGRLKPTHIIAIAANEPSDRLPPESSVRRPEKIALSSPSPVAYEWNSWPHDAQRELEVACHRLAGAGEEIKQRTAWALDLQNQLQDRTAWALSLEKELQTRTAWARRIERDLEERTAWVQSLQAEIKDRNALAVNLQQKIEALENEVEERSNWALRLKNELETTRPKGLIARIRGRLP